MRRKTQLILALLVSLCIGLIQGKVYAQGELHIYEALIVSETPDASLKLLFSSIVDEYSTADVAHDNDTGILTIHVHFDLEVEWLANVCSNAGYRLDGLWRDGVPIL